MKRFFRILLFTIVGTLLALWLITLLLSTARVQKVITGVATSYLSDYLGSKVEVGGIYYRFFNRLNLKNVYVEDLQGDTLLYVGELEVKISVSALLNKNIKIKSADLISPKAFVHRAANDTTFNYQFIVDKFTSTDTTKKDFKLELDVDRLKITLLDFYFLDEYKRTRFKTNFSQLNISGFDFSTKTNELMVDAIVLDDANVQVAVLNKFNHTTDSLLLKVIDATEEVVKKPGKPFKASLKHLLINNTILSYDNNNYEQQCKGVDYAHVMVSKLKLYAEDINFQGDSLVARLQQINAFEQSGFELKRLTADFKMNANTMEFSNLIIETPKSSINNYFSMSYDNLGDFSDFLNKIILRGRFEKSVVDIKDINYFAKALDPIQHNIVTLSGQVRGTISNIKGRNLILDAGKISRFTGDIDLRGLPNIDETFISASFDKVRTDIDDINRIYPGIKFPKEPYRLGLCRISGNFDGFYNDFVADVQVISQIGMLESDINVKFKDGIETADYSGKVSAIDFDLGKLIEEPLLGRTSLNAEVKGTGLSLQTVESRIDGIVQSIEANGYAYSDITVQGQFTKSTFVGEAIAKDANCELDFSGAIDFSTAIPLFNFKSKVYHANLAKLNFTKDSITLKSEMDLNFSGYKIDDIVGTLDIKNTYITKKDRSYTIDNILLESIVFDDEGTKKITLESDVLNAEARGRISFKDIGTTFKYFFNNYFKTTAVELDKSKAKDYAQDFDFYVNINNGTGSLTELIDDKLTNIGITNISGSFVSAENRLKLDLASENVDYGNFKFKTIKTYIDGTPQAIFLRHSIDSLMYRDSVFTEKINLTAKLNRDTIKYQITVQDSLNPNRVNLNGIIQTDLASITNQFNNSSFHFNNQPWLIKENNRTYFDGKVLRIDNLDIAQDYHRIIVSSAIDKDSSSNLSVILNDVLLKDILSAVPALKRINISGNANGSVQVLDLLRKPIPTATLAVDSLSIDNSLLGTLTAKSVYSIEDKLLNVSASLMGNNNDVLIKGKYNTSPANESFDFNAQIKKIELGFVNPFLKGIVSGTKGSASGNLKLTGNTDKPVLTGKLNLQEASSTVDFLNMNLSMKNQDIVFSENKIELGNLTLYDRNNNTATARGHIYHTNLSKFCFNINIDTDKFEFMNTTAAASGQFYGQAYGSARVSIKGPLNDLVFDIKAQTQKNTKMSIAVSGGKDVSEYTFFRFVDKDNPEANIVRQYAKRSTGVEFNLDLTATPDAEIDLVLSTEQGDVLSARGEGNLKIVFDKNQELSIIGNYMVTEGEYLFSMQNVISKRFKIDRGSQIVWAGSPYDARLAITASYSLRASPYDLIEDIVRSSNERMQQARIRLLVQLLLNIGGSISDPEISFDIKIPDADPAIRTAVNSKLDFIRLDKNLFDQQVVGLLVLNKFLPVQNAGQNSDNTSNFVSGASNTVSEFVSNQLSNYLSDWLSNFVTDLQLDVNYRTYQSGLEGEGTSDFESRRELQLALSKSFFNNRVFVDVGGNFDFSGNTPEGTPTNQRGNNVAGDFEIQYALTPDGRYKLKAFSRGEYDVFTERNRNRTGIGVQYKKEFDNWKDLTTPAENKSNRKKKKEAKKEIMLREEEEAVKD